MTKLILVAAFLTMTVAAAAQAHPARQHHRPRAMVYPDSVMLEGKQYKVCKPGMQDDCVQPRQAGLGYGNTPTNIYRPHHKGRHR